METKATLKLPQALDSLRIDIYNHSGIDLKFIQEKPPQFVEGKWLIEIFLFRCDSHLKLISDDRPGA